MAAAAAGPAPAQRFFQSFSDALMEADPQAALEELTKALEQKSESQVIITLMIKNVQKNDVNVEFSEKELSASVDLPSGEDYNLKLRLLYPIIPVQSIFKVLSTKIEVKMKKTEADIKIKNAESWKSLGKPVKTSGVMKSSDELFNQFRKAAIEKEVKARTQELMRKHPETNTKEPKTSQENQRDLGNGLVLESFTNKTQNKCQGEEQKEHQQSLEAQDQCKLWLLKGRNLAKEKEQERRRREAMAGTIDMTLQSDIMTMFENNFD
ncbi:Bromodomain testis-specific protein [Tupaia chinensis]|uniref:Bromodomain testis-specific protein n=1 Tax=Tupaia chinensis TaxID=246437 RepID=L9LFK4_TUPCH|nr:Bromodomain testis-specific protein [Tupaia chinensis]